MTTDYEVCWHGAAWRDDYHPKPAPVLRSRDTVQTRRGARTRDGILAQLQQQPMTRAQLLATRQCGTDWAIRGQLQRLKASGAIQVVGHRYGSEGPPAAVYGVRR